jgi:hypothetical protein
VNLFKQSFLSLFSVKLFQSTIANTKAGAGTTGGGGGGGGGGGLVVVVPVQLLVNKHKRRYAFTACPEFT